MKAHLYDDDGNINNKNKLIISILVNDNKISMKVKERRMAFYGHQMKPEKIENEVLNLQEIGKYEDTWLKQVNKDLEKSEIKEEYVTNRNESGRKIEEMKDQCDDKLERTKTVFLDERNGECRSFGIKEKNKYKKRSCEIITADG